MKTAYRNIPFDLFDYEIQEKDLKYYAQAIAQGCIRKVNQLAANRWSYLLKSEDQLLEVEMTYNANSIKSHSCACGSKSPGKPCKHALLVAYWHYQKIRPAKSGSAQDALAFKHLLQQSSKDDLEYYLQFLARTNPLNAKWLQFFLECRIPSTEAMLKYKSQLNQFDQFVQQLTKNKAISNKIRLQICEELYQIAFGHYQNFNIEESVLATLNAIDYLHQWRSRAEWRNLSKMSQLNDKLHSALLPFLQSLIAPESLEKVNSYILHTAEKAYYVPLNERSNLFEILLLRQGVSDLPEPYFSTLLSKLKSDWPNENKFVILDYLFKKRADGTMSFLKSSKWPDSVSVCLNYLSLRDKKLPVDLVLDLYGYLFGQTTGDLQSHVAGLYHKVFLGSPSIDRANMLLDFYFSTGRTAFLSSYFNHFERTGATFSEFQNLLQKSRPDLKLNTGRLLDLTYFSQSWPEFLALISEQNDIELLMHYDAEFPEEHRGALIDDYVNLAAKYLKEHVGQPAQQYIMRIHRHIRLHYPPPLYERYLKKMKILFPDRKLFTSKI
ncbi:MAG TPA: hypothetical protein VFX48_01425 [Saprospiraceae bacterium]|nr:hypothetical protein [Saprospiraceae bacterium]